MINVLHYTLGLPPFRTGGLTKYATDLISCEQNLNVITHLFYPGRLTNDKKVKIHDCGIHNQTYVYQMDTPIPVPLLNGVTDPSILMQRIINSSIIEQFLTNIKPDCIHLHTLMGLPKEFLEMANKLDIPIIFTTHDYFGLSTVPYIFQNQTGNYMDGFNLPILNKEALNLRKMRLLQSKLYRIVKNISLVSALRAFQKKHILKHALDYEQDIYFSTPIENPQMNILRSYYLKMFRLVKLFHFNSSVSKQVYTDYLGNINGKIISITHSDIKDERKKKEYISSRPLKIVFLGSLEMPKGFFQLKKTMGDLLNTGKSNWVVNVYGNQTELSEDDSPHFIGHGRYNYQDLRNILDTNDVLVIPSVWFETFGFIGLEALSFGMPVIVSDKVGMKDFIVQHKNGYIYKDEYELKMILEKIIDDRRILTECNNQLLKENLPFSMEQHTRKMIKLYKKIILDNISMNGQGEKH